MFTKINLSSVKHITADGFELICQDNPDLKLELSASGELIIVSPTGGETGNKNAILITLFGIWNETKKLGLVFDSSTCFRLPNGAVLSPDVSWIIKQRWETLTPEQKKKFPPLAPDFVLELMSPSDTLKETQDKMREYMDAGVRLGWLLNRANKTVEIYRTGQDKEVLTNPVFLSGELVLPDFVLDLNRIWTDS